MILNCWSSRLNSPRREWTQRTTSWTRAIHRSGKWRMWAGAIIQAWACAALSRASGCCHSLHRTLHPLPTAGKAADTISVTLYWCCFLVCQPQSWSLVSLAALVKLVHFFLCPFYHPFSPQAPSLFSHLSPSLQLAFCWSSIFLQLLSATGTI